MGITHYHKEIWGIPDVLSEEICPPPWFVAHKQNNVILPTKIKYFVPCNKYCANHITL